MVTQGVSALALAPFDGSKAADLAAWIRTAQSAITAADLDSAMYPGDSAELSAKRTILDQRAAAALQVHLSGAAHQACRSLKATTPADVFARLQLVFSPAKSAASAYDRLLAFHRPAGMEVDEAYGILLGLCFDVNADISCATSSAASAPSAATSSRPVGLQRTPRRP